MTLLLIAVCCLFFGLLGWQLYLEQKEQGESCIKSGLALIVSAIEKEL